MALLLLLGGGPLAYDASAAGWRSSRVVYRDLSTYPAAVRKAVAQWNAVPARVRLVPARGGRRAHITIRTAGLGPNVAGMAEFPPGGRVWLSPRLSREGPVGLSQATEVAAHELGHALGLDHIGVRCSLMHATSYLSEPSCSPGDSTVRCGPQRADVRRLARLYGWVPGGRTIVRGPMFGRCPPPEEDGSDEPEPREGNEETDEPDMECTTRSYTEPDGTEVTETLCEDAV